MPANDILHHRILQARPAWALGALAQELPVLGDNIDAAPVKRGGIFGPRSQCFQRLGELIWVPDVILIREGDKIAAVSCVICGSVSRVRKFTVAPLARPGNKADLPARQARRESLDNRAGRITRAVIGDDQPPVPMALRGKRLQLRADMRRAIVARHQEIVIRVIRLFRSFVQASHAPLRAFIAGRGLRGNVSIQRLTIAHQATVTTTIIITTIPAISGITSGNVADFSITFAGQT